MRVKGGDEGGRIQEFLTCDTINPFPPRKQPYSSLMHDIVNPSSARKQLYSPLTCGTVNPFYLLKKNLCPTHTSLVVYLSFVPPPPPLSQVAPHCHQCGEEDCDHHCGLQEEGHQAPAQEQWRRGQHQWYYRLRNPDPG